MEDEMSGIEISRKNQIVVERLSEGEKLGLNNHQCPCHTFLAPYFTPPALRFIRFQENNLMF
uniref:Uncharacterized protein n=1 Tax=Arion vulgaris TaxID=1028688 RepID=A0A0B6Z0F8_9EUPU